MRITVHATLQGQDLQSYTGFLWNAAHQHPRQDPRFESSDRADGLDVRYVIGWVDGQIRAVAYFSRYRHKIVKGAYAEAISFSGPVCDDPAELVAFVEAVRKAPEFARVGVLRITPYWLEDEGRSLRAQLAMAGWKPFETDEYRQTGLVDISPSVEGLMGSFSATARRKIRKCEREGIAFSICTEEAEALDFLERLNKMRASRGLQPVKEQGFLASFREVYRDAEIGVLIIARHNGHFVAGAQVLRSNVTVHLRHFCSDEMRLREAGNLRIAPIITLYQMKWAKSKGCRLYDFEGYVAEAPDSHPLYNIYLYKREFHPTSAQRIPGHAIVISPFLHVTGNARDLVKAVLKPILNRFKGTLKKFLPASLIG